MKIRTMLAASLLILIAPLALAADTAAADQALLKAGLLHKRGDTPRAVAIWRTLAGQGNADAAYNLGVVHQYGDGVACDAQAALKWYKQAAEAGDKPAQFQVGLMYQNGEGVPADPKLAHEWFVRNRHDHVHHHHSAQFQQWQAQARVLLAARDRQEALARSRQDGERIVAELRRRLEQGAEPGMPVLAGEALTPGG